MKLLLRCENLPCCHAFDFHFGRICCTGGQYTRKFAKEIPWHKIRGLRNRMVHEYFDINSQALWQIAPVEAPQLKAPLLVLFG